MTVGSSALARWLITWNSFSRDHWVSATASRSSRTRSGALRTWFEELFEASSSHRRRSWRGDGRAGRHDHEQHWPAEGDAAVRDRRREVRLAAAAGAAEHQPARRLRRERLARRRAGEPVAAQAPAGMSESKVKRVSAPRLLSAARGAGGACRRLVEDAFARLRPAEARVVQRPLAAHEAGAAAARAGVRGRLVSGSERRRPGPVVPLQCLRQELVDPFHTAALLRPPV